MPTRIDFSTEGVEMPSVNRADVCRWLTEVAAAHDRRVGQVFYCFCDDETILRVNREFINHDYYTDIITFDYSHGRMIAGDIYLSLDTVRTNAEKFGQPYDRELRRVIVHGVLHLCGINDKGPGEREIMEAHEDAALDLWDKLFSRP